MRDICIKHHVPYVQESVFLRLKKTVDIMTGKTSMRRYPNAYEIEKDLAAEVSAEAKQAPAH